MDTLHKYKYQVLTSEYYDYWAIFKKKFLRKNKTPVFIHNNVHSFFSVKCYTYMEGNIMNLSTYLFVALHKPSSSFYTLSKSLCPSALTHPITQGEAEWRRRKCVKHTIIRISLFFLLAILEDDWHWHVMGNPSIPW